MPRKVNLQTSEIGKGAARSPAIDKFDHRKDHEYGYDDDDHPYRQVFRRPTYTMAAMWAMPRLSMLEVVAVAMVATNIGLR